MAAIFPPVSNPDSPLTAPKRSKSCIALDGSFNSKCRTELLPPAHFPQFPDFFGKQQFTALLKFQAKGRTSVIEPSHRQGYGQVSASGEKVPKTISLI